MKTAMETLVLPDNRLTEYCDECDDATNDEHDDDNDDNDDDNDDNDDDDDDDNLPIILIIFTYPSHKWYRDECKLVLGTDMSLHQTIELCL